MRVRLKSLLVQIEKERESEQIDRALLKNVLDIFAGIGRGKWSISCDTSKNRKADMSSINLYQSWEDMSALRSWEVWRLILYFPPSNVSKYIKNIL